RFLHALPKQMHQEAGRLTGSPHPPRKHVGRHRQAEGLGRLEVGNGGRDTSRPPGCTIVAPPSRGVKAAVRRLLGSFPCQSGDECPRGRRDRGPDIRQFVPADGGDSCLLVSSLKVWERRALNVISKAFVLLAYGVGAKVGNSWSNRTARVATGFC